MPAQSPVACTYGDIFCRECALANILAQKKEIKRLGKVRERAEAGQKEEEERVEAEERQRAVADFNNVQMGLEVSLDTNARKNAPRDADMTRIKQEMPSEPTRRPEKRKFELDENELIRINKDDRAKMRKVLDDEKNAKATLPSFWVPSVEPSSNTGDVLHEIKRNVKTAPACPSSQQDQPHYYALHSLITVSFAHEEDEKTGDVRPSCPACKKALSNSSKAVLTKPCGHVICQSCVGKFMSGKSSDPHAPPEEAARILCYVCESDLTATKKKPAKEKDGKEKITPGMVEINSEGTGFASRGSNKVIKDGVAFQC